MTAATRKGVRTRPFVARAYASARRMTTLERNSGRSEGAVGSEAIDSPCLLLWVDALLSEHQAGDQARYLSVRRCDPVGHVEAAQFEHTAGV